MSGYCPDCGNTLCVCDAIPAFADDPVAMGLGFTPLKTQALRDYGDWAERNEHLVLTSLLRLAADEIDRLRAEVARHAPAERSTTIQAANCGKVHRHEHHEAHRWTFQPEDDSPAVIFAVCPGFYALPATLKGATP